jgi:hypothetical protein
MKLFAVVCLSVIVGLCSAAEQVAAPEPKDDQLCQMCEQLIGKYLNNATLQQLLHQVESYCGYLPGGLGDQCKSMVDQYGQQIIKEILGKYNAKTICTDLLHVCQGKQVFLLAGIPFQQAPGVKQQDPCAMCKQVIGQVLNEQTLENLLSRVESFCDKLPFGEECHTILHKFGEQLIDSILAKYTPDSVCKDIFHVCSRDKSAAPVFVEHPLLVQLLAKQSNDQLCDTCMNVAGQLLTEKTLSAILDRVEAMCDRLPGFVADECHKIVQSEGKQFVAQILASYTPAKVCQQFLHLCQK